MRYHTSHQSCSLALILLALAIPGLSDPVPIDANSEASDLNSTSGSSTSNSTGYVNHLVTNNETEDLYWYCDYMQPVGDSHPERMTPLERAYIALWTSRAAQGMLHLHNDLSLDDNRLQLFLTSNITSSLVPKRPKLGPFGRIISSNSPGQLVPLEVGAPHNQSNAGLTLSEFLFKSILQRQGKIGCFAGPNRESSKDLFRSYILADPGFVPGYLFPLLGEIWELVRDLSEDAARKADLRMEVLALDYVMHWRSKPRPVTFLSYVTQLLEHLSF